MPAGSHEARRRVALADRYRVELPRGVWRALSLALSACGTTTVRPSPGAEQLTCGDGTMPRATCARASRAERSDSLAGVAIIVVDPGHVDTVVIATGTPCTLIWRGGGSSMAMMSWSRGQAS